MKNPNWTYMLRIMRNPDRIPMERLGEYVREFARLLGVENGPRFKGIKKASTGLKAYIPPSREHEVSVRLFQAKSDPCSRAAKSRQVIEDMLGKDAINDAQLLDANENIVFHLRGESDDLQLHRLQQKGVVDGVVTGVVGADDTMTLHLRDHLNQDLRLEIRNEALARELLLKFRGGMVRVYVDGSWLRTASGWKPEASKCRVERFEILDDTPIGQIFEALAAIDGSEWKSLKDPMNEWRSLRGMH